jgi:hypothetical protein
MLGSVSASDVSSFIIFVEIQTLTAINNIFYAISFVTVFDRNHR